MKKVLIILAVAVFVTSVVLVQTKTPNNQKADNNTSPNPSTNESTEDISVIAQNLDTPWAIAFLPDNSMLVTERSGQVRLVDKDGSLSPNPIATISKVREIGEGGLLGIDIHPQFSTNNYVYLYYTYSGTGDNTLNRVVRMTYKNNTLSDEQIIVDQIPGASNHNGGRIKFGPDGFLYITTGDAGEPSRAQDTTSLAGKILRVTDEGKSASGNPFGNLVYSYGHRNPQGLTWDKNNTLWSSEHGPSGVQSGNDELNKIEAGKNYGWPTIQGDQTREGMVSPIRHSGTSTTWAPGGIAAQNSQLFFVGLRGQTLYKTTITNNKVTDFKEYFKNEYGRLREVVFGPDGYLYITTSNKDGRGSANPQDDKIIKVNPESLN